MMHPVFYYILFYLGISAAGMYVANRKVEAVIQQQRWLKYFTYVLLVAIVIFCIFWNRFYWLAAIIIITGALELVNANFFLAEKGLNNFVFIFFLYAIIAVGFFGFSKNFNPSIHLFIYFQVFAFDAFCQITGQLFGRIVLSPKISPAKTVEGLAGGWLFCILSAVLACNWINMEVYVAILIGSLTAVTAFCGDMLASYFKRLVKIKDYSNLLPGQGGFLDRFDSLMMTGAVYYFVFPSVLKK